MTRYDPIILQKVHARRVIAAPVEERRRLGALWLDRAVRVHLADALAGAGSSEAAALARAGPRLDGTGAQAALAHLARVSSAHPPSTPPLHLALGVQALGRALEHLTRVAERPQELQLVADWIGKALIALEVDGDAELRAQVDDMGGLTDA